MDGHASPLGARGLTAAVRVLVTGARGQLGTELVGAFPGHQVVGVDLPEVDVADRDLTLAAVVAAAPDVVIHAAAATDVDRCQLEPHLAFAVNAWGTRNVAEGTALVGAHLCYVSTDYVFAGDAGRPYHEWDEPGPLSAYGRSKLAGERECRRVPGATIVRTSWLFGRAGANMVKTILRLAAEPGELRFVDDQRGCPTYASDLAPVIARLALARMPGVFHVTNQGATTWFGFARDVLAAAGHDPARVRPVATAELLPPRPAPRPAFSVLDNAALRLSGLPLLPDHGDALERLVPQLVPAAEAAAAAAAASSSATH